MIDDLELRELFSAESAEHLAKLDEGLLRLEKQPDDLELLKELFREAHSLKGSARMLGVVSVEKTAHRFEDYLGAASREERVISAELIDCMIQGLGDIRLLVREAITGEDPGVTVEEALARMDEPAAAPSAPAAAPSAPAAAPSATPSATFSAPPAPTPSSQSAASVVVESEDIPRIDDLELRELFSAECDEHLRKLDDGLLTLEKTPNDQELLKELFREAHSLKGSARMLGVVSVERVAHRFEDWLGEASRSQTAIDSERIDRMVAVLDDIRRMARAAITGEPAGVTVALALSRLEGQSAPAAPAQSPLAATTPSPTAATDDAPTAPPIAATAPADSPSSTEPAVAPEKASAPQVEVMLGDGKQIDTLRVEARKLDHLLNQASELTVVKTRLKRRLSQIEDALALWDAVARHGGPSQGVAAWDSGDPFMQLGAQLQSLRHDGYEDETNLDMVSRDLEEGIRNLRMLPLNALLSLFPRMVRNLSRQLGKRAELTIIGGETSADKRVIEEMKAPLTHIIRNAIHHGLEKPDQRVANGKPDAGRIVIRAQRTATHVVIEVEDDGRGLDLDAIRRSAVKRGAVSEQDIENLPDEQVRNLIFLSGFSTTNMVTDVSGRGVGLDAVRSHVDRLKGSVQVQAPDSGVGTIFTIKLPITLAATPVFIVREFTQRFAIPVDFIRLLKRVNMRDAFPLEGRDAIEIHGSPIPVVRLGALLNLVKPTAAYSDESGASRPTCLVLKSPDGGQLGILVDEVEDQLEVVMKPHSPVFQRIPNVSGATILGSGEVCSVLNPADLMLQFWQGGYRATERSDASATVIARDVAQTKMVLLVEDSITTRTQEKRILESAGYQVTTAVDGMDALVKLATQTVDAVISDVQMPNLDGLGLTEKIRQNEGWKSLPVILVTALASPEDMQRGMEVGADAYLTKPTFDQKSFLDTLRRLA
ncbi:hybrid sensor histidine kinase/response regulator [Magnetofaba australis]|uniref:Chemotaxis protein CheA n=1 Tax=Magnetofaba australis IT-1 TaxID=1434232 RepID=A0A1Y2K6H7_9PROT|nr:hybrid sensor histidine kinase/response regulator [Magnetofaba australis]OSM05140.1 putative CheA signal transduction histidine kinase [Magnetofaba australis IT-1]